MDAKEFIIKSTKLCNTHKCDTCPAGEYFHVGCPFDFKNYSYYSDKELREAADRLISIVENLKEDAE